MCLDPPSQGHHSLTNPDTKRKAVHSWQLALGGPACAEGLNKMISRVPSNLNPTVILQQSSLNEVRFFEDGEGPHHGAHPRHLVLSYCTITSQFIYSRGTT